MSGPAKLYKEYLSKEGYRPEFGPEGDVMFKAEGFLYFVEIDQDDEQFFRIIFPYFWSIETPEEHKAAVEAANFATMKTKVAKVYVHNDGKNTSASIELFLPEAEDFETIFFRSMRAIQAGVKCFRDRMLDDPLDYDEE